MTNSGKFKAISSTNKFEIPSYKELIRRLLDLIVAILMSGSFSQSLLLMIDSPM